MKYTKSYKEKSIKRFLWRINYYLFSILVKITKSKTIESIYWKYLHGFNAANDTVTLSLVNKSFRKALELGTTELGDYYEFGIFKGFTFLYAQKIAEEINLKKMRFFGFDSFKGLPEIKRADKTKYYAYYKNEMAWPKEKVIKDLDSRGADWNKTFLIEGFFKDSLNKKNKEKYAMDKISVALIDCDLCSSTVEVLEFIKDMLIDNAILIFDEYDSIVFRHDVKKGERKAFEEFLEKNKNINAEFFFSKGTGRAFIIHKN